MASAVVEARVFWKRVGRFYDHWKKAAKSKNFGADPTAGKDAPAVFIFVNGAKSEDVPYSRAASTMIWMFGVELNDAAVVATKEALTVYVPADTVAKLAALRDVEGVVPLKLEAVEADAMAESFAAVVASVPADDKRCGFLTKERAKMGGDFATGLIAALGEAGVKLVDVTVTISVEWAMKDEDELARLRKASQLTSKIYRDRLVSHMEDIVNEEKETTHDDVSEQIEAWISDFAKETKEDIEPCYAPIVQTGSEFDLRPSAVPDEQPFKHSDGAIIMSLGVRYRSYCSGMARTFFINPTPHQEQVYKLLLSVHRACLGALIKGNTGRHVWEAAHDLIKKKRPELLEHFTKDCGAAIGSHFREHAFILNAKAKRKFQPGMCFSLSVGFDKLSTPKKGGEDLPYACLITDVVVVRDDKEPADVLTTKPTNRYKDVIYTLDDGQEDAMSNSDDDGDGGEDDGDDDDDGDGDGDYDDDGHPQTRRRTRQSDQANAAEIDSMAAAKRKEIEFLKNLEEEHIQKRLQELRGQGGGPGFDDDDDEEKRANREFHSYRRAAEIPREFRTKTILSVDKNRQSIIVPIYGRMVPFHINTVKNVQKQEQGGYTTLRINFVTPKAGLGSSTKDLAAFADRNAVYVQELSYRCTEHQDALEFQTFYFDVQELRKRTHAAAKERAQKQTLVRQPKLQVMPRTERVVRLMDVSVKPLLSRGKTNGTLSIHKNGLRFVSSKNEVADVIYANIKHAIFQEATKTTVQAIIHFELVDDILINKKKTNFVQFYMDYMEASQSLDHVHGVSDERAMREEEAEVRRREKINTSFKKFARQVEIASNKYVDEGNNEDYKVEFDVPYKRRAFKGVPGKEITDVIPSVYCLTALEDQTPLCVTLEDIELVVLERVRFDLRNFDMTIIYKDFTRDVTQISSIETKYLEEIKTWLRQIGKLYYESKANLLWKNVLKEIANDPESFYDDGGWRLMFGGAGGEGDSDDEEEDEDDDESEFEPPSSDPEDDDDYTSDEISDEEDPLDDEPLDSEEEEEEGEDWEELEREALLSDRRKFGQVGDDERRRGTKRGAQSGRGRPPSGKRQRRP